MIKPGSVLSFDDRPLAPHDHCEVATYASCKRSWWTINKLRAKKLRSSWGHKRRRLKRPRADIYNKYTFFTKFLRWSSF